MSSPTIPPPASSPHAPTPVPSPATDRSDRYCVIGAGPSGLATARAFLRAGIPLDVLERHRDVGGIWDMENPGTPMYESAHFISSRTQSAFAEFPMPADYPDYPSWRQIREYIRAYADAFGLRGVIEHGVTVERVRPVGDAWEVLLASGEVRRYRGVVCASGHDWEPLLPEYPGTFTGQAYHSMHYHAPSQFAGRRVLIVGGGNSGIDLACDAATHAQRAYLSLRRGYHFLPKHLFGRPTDAFFRSGPHLPTWLAQPLLTVLLRLLVGDLRRYGLPKPDHRVLETHPIMNTQVLHHLAHGRIGVRPDVQSLDGQRVRFVDGSEIEVDTIVWATGYRTRIPYLERGGVGLGTGASELYFNLVARAYPGLFLVGHFATDGAAYPVVSRQAELVARVIHARAHDQERARWFDGLVQGPRPALNAGVHYVHSPRHAIYVQFDEYVHRLDSLLAKLPAPWLTRAGGVPTAPTASGR